MKVYYVFSIETPHWGNSNEYTQHNIFHVTQKNTLNYPKPAARAANFFQETQEQVRNSRGKQVISVWAIEVLLYLFRLGYLCICSKYHHQGCNGLHKTDQITNG